MINAVVIRGHRKDLLEEALDRLGIDRPRKKVVVKPKLSGTDGYPLSVPSDLVETLVEIFREKYGKGIIIAASAFGGDTAVAYKVNNYLELGRRYGLLLIDLKRDVTVKKEKESGVLRELHVPRTLLDSYLVCVSTFGGIAESPILSVGNLIDVFKEGWVFQGLKSWEYSLEILEFVYPDLSLIDMRKVRTAGRDVDLGRIVLSRSPLIADFLAMKLVGLEPRILPYLRLAEERGILDPDHVEFMEL